MIILCTILLTACVVVSINLLAWLEYSEKRKYMLIIEDEIKFFSCYKDVKFYILSETDKCIAGYYSLYIKDKDEYICVTKKIVE